MCWGQRHQSLQRWRKWSEGLTLFWGTKEPIEAGQVYSYSSQRSVISFRHGYCWGKCLTLEVKVEKRMPLLSGVIENSSRPCNDLLVKQQRALWLTDWSRQEVLPTSCHLPVRLVLFCVRTGRGLVTLLLSAKVTHTWNQQRRTFASRSLPFPCERRGQIKHLWQSKFASWLCVVHPQGPNTVTQ